MNTPTYFWLDAGVWAEQSVEASFGPVWVRAAATPVKVLIDQGDGSPTVECPFDPPAYVSGTPTADFAGCAHRYLNSSAVANTATELQDDGHLPDGGDHRSTSREPDVVQMQHVLQFGRGCLSRAAETGG